MTEMESNDKLVCAVQKNAMEPHADTRTDEEELKKTDSKRSATRLSGAALDLCGGTAGAAAEALKAFQNEIKSGQVDRARAVEALLFATMAGNAKFFEELANTSRTLCENLRQPAETEKLKIDYEKLAKLVAAELKVLEAKERSATG